MSIPAPSERPSRRAAPQGGASPNKATLLGAQGDALGGKATCSARKATVFGRKVTLLGGFGPEPRHKRQPPALLRIAVALLVLALAAPLAAKDSLGVFGDWGAFRDPQVPRCYAIAAAQNARSGQPFASVGTWPRRQVRGQLHVRLSRIVAQGAAISVRVGGQRFALTGAGTDAWAQDRRMDAAIVAAMRSAPSMSVSARARTGRRFTDRYSLAGAATAMDAATVGCARAK